MPQCVLVSGCSSGIGLATACLLAEHGVHVFATVRSQAGATRLAAFDGVEPVVCDVTDDAKVANLRSVVDARGDGVWGIVHNAGIAHLGLLTTTSLDDLRAVFEVVARFAPPADASDDLKALFAPGADTSRSEFPGPEPVAAACHAALFDEAPLERYLVVPNADEADRTLAQAAREWARLNASTPHAWSHERLVDEIAAHGAAVASG